jgi:Ala-tRNA(Pro) deacylase
MPERHGGRWRIRRADGFRASADGYKLIRVLAVRCAGFHGVSDRSSTAEDPMSAAPELARYLSSRGISYSLVPHERTGSSMTTAQECHVSGDRLAKAVVLLDDKGYFVAVLPASHHLHFAKLERQGHWPVRMATEDEISRLFPDCDIGAVPPLGAAYGLETIVDDCLSELPDVYFEGGDHATLVHVSGQAFDRLMAEAPHAHFSLHG